MRTLDETNIDLVLGNELANKLDGVDLLNNVLHNFEIIHNYSQELKEFNLENTAMLQMYLYSLLVMPREILNDTTNIKICCNDFIKQVAEVGTFSNYSNEDTITSIDYYRHIRNAIAHSRVRFSVKNENV